MIDVSLHLNKETVYEEVAQTTSYTGAKMSDDGNAYERIFTTDEDHTMLERFWNESKNMACNSLKQVLLEECEENGTYIIRLGLSNSFDESLTESMERSMFSFFVMNIVSKWYNFANKPEAAAYASEAATNMEDVMRKAYYKKRPTRPKY